MTDREIRDRLVELMCEVKHYESDDLTYNDIENIADHLIENGVTVPVRCKDCKHCDFCYPCKEKDKEAVPAWYCNLHRFYVKADDYCSYGKLKEREG